MYKNGEYSDVNWRCVGECISFHLAVVICSIDYLQTTLMVKERDMI